MLDRKIKRTIIWLEDKIKAHQGKRQLDISEKKAGAQKSLSQVSAPSITF